MERPRSAPCCFYYSGFYFWRMNIFIFKGIDLATLGLLPFIGRKEVDLATLGLLPFIGREEVDLATLGLLLPDENIHRHSVEVPFCTDLVLKEALVWLLYILWQVREEQERWNACLVQLHTVLDLDVLTLC